MKYIYIFIYKARFGHLWASHTLRRRLPRPGLYWQFLRGGVATFLYSFLWGPFGARAVAALGEFFRDF